MNRGRSWRIRTLPFWAPRMALPSTDSANCGTVTSALPRSTLVSTTVPARLLTDFVGTLPEKDLEMALDLSTQTLSLKCARFDTHVMCIEAEEFPPGPRPDEGDRLSIPLDELLAAIEQTQMAASTDEARPVLTGVLLHIDRDGQTLAATDGHRLAVRKLQARGGSDLEARLIVPARALAELPRAFRGESGEVEVIVSKARNQIFFRAGTSEVTSRLIDGTYPNYTQVIPTKSSIRPCAPSPCSRATPPT